MGTIACDIAASEASLRRASNQNVNCPSDIFVLCQDVKDRQDYNIAASKGGATQGFKALSNYDQNLMKRIELERHRETLSLGIEAKPSIEPDTPKGHTEWRRR